jgi:hypothetical protein
VRASCAPVGHNGIDFDGHASHVKMLWILSGTILHPVSSSLQDLTIWWENANHPKRRAVLWQ